MLQLIAFKTKNGLNVFKSTTKRRCFNRLKHQLNKPKSKKNPFSF